MFPEPLLVLLIGEQSYKKNRIEDAIYFIGLWVFMRVGSLLVERPEYELLMIECGR